MKEPKVPASINPVTVPRWWTAFVLGWLLPLLIVAGIVIRYGLTARRLLASLSCLVLLAGLYLWLTLRRALTPADSTAQGPTPPLVRRRLLVVVAMALLVIVLTLLIPGVAMWWLFMHAVVAAGLALPPILATATTLSLLVIALVVAWLDGQVQVMLLLLVAFGAGAMAIRQLTLTVAQLGDAREELARSAVNEERVRFARDLHDLLGHSLSMIVLKSELAGRLIRDAPTRAAAEVAEIERAARDALREVRAAVAGYRQPSLRSELAAARELLSAAGIDSDIEHSGGSVPPAVDGLLAWAVREGVTNVIRHSRARSCTIRVGRVDAEVTVEVSDDGRGVDSNGPAGGSGLAGLAERAASHGGRVVAGPRPGGGFQLVMAASLSAADGQRQR
jgi:two-component system, NarL family, sensor histidine kinase DesK